jgi:hypothetical protein
LYACSDPNIYLQVSIHRNPAWLCLPHLSYSWAFHSALPGYVCRICHIPGHFIQHCPSKNNPPTPGYICYKCGIPGHFIQCCPNYGDRKYDSGRTFSLTPVVSSFDDKIPKELVQGMSTSTGDSLPAQLHCPLCMKVMTDAMLTSKCCYDSFCDKCKSCEVPEMNCIFILEISIGGYCKIVSFPFRFSFVHIFLYNG